MYRKTMELRMSIPVRQCASRGIEQLRGMSFERQQLPFIPSQIIQPSTSRIRVLEANSANSILQPGRKHNIITR